MITVDAGSIYRYIMIFRGYRLSNHRRTYSSGKQKGNTSNSHRFLEHMASHVHQALRKVQPRRTLIRSMFSGSTEPSSGARNQYSQLSRAPVEPGGGTAKRLGRDETAQCSPSSSVNLQDGRHYEGQRTPRCETISGRRRQVPS